MRKVIIFSCVAVFASLAILFAQGAGTGTPRTLRVLTDANNYLMTSVTAQTLPLSQPTQFTNARLVTDSNGYLITVISGSVGPLSGSVTLDTTAGNAFRRLMTTPVAPTMSQNQSGTDIAAGVYQTALVGVDSASGTSLPSATQAVTVGAGGAGRIVFTYVAPIGSASVRAYVSLAAGSVPDRYFTCTASPCNINTLTGATVAALPTANTAYRFNIGGETVNWVGLPLLLPDGTAGAPGLAFASDTDTGIQNNTANNFAIIAGGNRTVNISPSAVTIAALTATTAVSPLAITQTANNVAVVFPGIKFTMTEGASGTSAATNLLDLWYGTSGAEASKFLVDKSGFMSASSSVQAGQSSFFQWNGRSRLASTSDGIVRLTDNANTGFTTLNLGPTSGNTTSGTLSISKVTVACVIATDTNCSGKGTGTITTSTGIPAGSLVLGVTARVITTIAGSDGIATWALGATGGTGTEWGAALNLAATTTTSIANFVVTTPTYYPSATNITFKGTSGKIIDSGAITITIYYINLIPISV